jgi:glucan phosphoethanolaminetransferase (alkaline phosphatase superfamily)
MNMSGIPFCDAARECKKICQTSKHFVGDYSPIKHYRFAAHVLCVAAVFLMTWFILRKRVWGPDFWHYAVLIVVIYAIVTWFVDIHADAAEGLQTSYLAEHYIEEDFDYMPHFPVEYVNEFKSDLNRKNERDGQC